MLGIYKSDLSVGLKKMFKPYLALNAFKKSNYLKWLLTVFKHRT